MVKIATQRVYLVSRPQIDERALLRFQGISTPMFDDITIENGLITVDRSKV